MHLKHKSYSPHIFAVKCLVAYYHYYLVSFPMWFKIFFMKNREVSNLLYMNLLWQNCIVIQAKLKCLKEAEKSSIIKTQKYEALIHNYTLHF